MDNSIKNLLRTRRLKLFALTFVLFIIGSTIILFIGSKTFLKKKADQITSANLINLTATATYKDQSGNDQTDRSATATVRKVTALKINLQLQGDDKGIIKKEKLFLASFIDPASEQIPLGDSLHVDQNGELTPDWTLNPKITPETQSYDLEISAPGYLSKKILDAHIIDSSGSQELGTMHPGDVNGDGTINWQDYIEWKAKYSQSVGSADPADFNGDGKIDFVDFAVSFGSSCYNATENNQDTQCQK